MLKKGELTLRVDGEEVNINIMNSMKYRFDFSEFKSVGELLKDGKW